MPPFLLAALRFLFAARARGVPRRPPGDAVALLVGYGFAIGVLQFGLLFLGMKLGMPAGLSSLVIQTQVFFTIGARRGVRWRPAARAWNVAGGLVALAGVVLLAPYKLGARRHGHVRRLPRW